MGTNGIPKQALQYRPKGRRNIGWPKNRWRDQLHFEDQGTGNTPDPSWTSSWSKFFLKPIVTVPVAPIITGTIIHFVFHICCISIHTFLYFSFFSASFCTTFLSAGIATSISTQVFSFLFLIIISGLFAVTSVSVCTAWFHNTLTSSCSYTGLGARARVCVCLCVCVYHLSVVSLPRTLHIEYCKYAQTLLCLISIHSSPKWRILNLGGQ